MSQRSKNSNKAKIIVRNLPFKNLSEKTLENMFKEYGDIEEVKILRKNDGKFVGCGFIKFTKPLSAAKAIHICNQKEMQGRKIIVDWALPKNTYLEKLKEFSSYDNAKSKGLPITEESEGENIPAFGDNKNSYNDDFEENKLSIIKSEPKDEVSSNESESEDEDNSEIEENEDDSQSDIESINVNIKNEKTLPKKNESKFRSNDVNDGKTLFIRNVPFSATNEDLKNVFEKFGPLEYALMCVDKLTEHNKGTAFVKFKEKNDALSCLKDSKNLFLQENPLTVTVALSKESLEDKKKCKKTVKDSRNLYLIREGVIVAGSKAAVGVSASDMAKRLQLEQWKTQILKNLNMFVSKTRLIIHNLPLTYDDSKLKQLFAKYSNPKAIIKEAKVMYNKKKLDSSGKGISKEYGFVSFTNHEDALTALRNINNNPNIFTPKRRPIVSFSIENKAVINAKQKSVEKSRIKLNIVTNNSMSKLNRKQRRFIRRRQKIIEKRREAKRLKLDEQRSKVEADAEEKKNRKRKAQREPEGVLKKKSKISESKPNSSEQEMNSFVGIVSKAGQKIKLRSRFKLKTQANIHSQTIRMEKLKKKEKERKKSARQKTKSEKQSKKRQKKSMDVDDEKLSKLIKRHRESVQNSYLSKWYEK